MNITFVDMNPRFIDYVREAFRDQQNVQCQVGDIKDISREDRVFVTPSNSLMMFNGGIDYIYNNEVFPGIQSKFKEKLRLLPNKELGVGSAILVAKGNSALIAAPVMHFKDDVSRTMNAYHAFMATLCVYAKYTGLKGIVYDGLITPLFCTGNGKMDVKESVEQMRLAYDNFLLGIIPDETSNVFDPDMFITRDQFVVRLQDISVKRDIVYTPTNEFCR